MDCFAEFSTIYDLKNAEGVEENMKEFSNYVVY